MPSSSPLYAVGRVPLLDVVTSVGMLGFDVRARREALRLLDPRPGERILDVACGTGRNLPRLAAAVGSAGAIIGIDRSGALLKRAERRTAGLPNVELVCGDFMAFDSDARSGRGDLLPRALCPGRLAHGSRSDLRGNPSRRAGRGDGLVGRRPPIPGAQRIRPRRVRAWRSPIPVAASRPPCCRACTRSNLSPPAARVASRGGCRGCARRLIGRAEGVSRAARVAARGFRQAPRTRRRTAGRGRASQSAVPARAASPSERRAPPGRRHSAADGRRRV